MSNYSKSMISCLIFSSLSHLTHFTFRVSTSLSVNFHFPISHRYKTGTLLHDCLIHQLYLSMLYAIYCHKFFTDLDHHHICQGSIALPIKLDNHFIVVSLLQSNTRGKQLHTQNFLESHPLMLHAINYQEFLWI